MSLTQDIANMVQAANNLTGEVAGKMNAIDQRMDQAEQETDAAIARLNAGNLDSLILVKNQRGIDIGFGKIYQRFVCAFTGESDGGGNAWMDLLKLQGDYNGQALEVNFGTYNRGNYLGANGRVAIRFASYGGTVSRMTIAAVTNDVTSYFKVFNASGVEVVKDANGYYELGYQEKATIKVLVKQYYQVNAVVDATKM
ncbi:hypothetical protein WOC35_19415 [Vibrio parahaemolyticus]|uniref:hypothetical protein n=1 Tax=Vibrio parahaemolyticus TaxID=670 RepID=UPI002F2BF74A